MREKRPSQIGDRDSTATIMIDGMEKHAYNNQFGNCHVLIEQISNRGYEQLVLTIIVMEMKLHFHRTIKYFGGVKFAI